MGGRVGNDVWELVVTGGRGRRETGGGGGPTHIGGPLHESKKTFHLRIFCMEKEAETHCWTTRRRGGSKPIEGKNPP